MIDVMIISENTDILYKFRVLIYTSIRTGIELTVTVKHDFEANMD